MADNATVADKHQWRVGDLCRYYVGSVFRVVRVYPAKTSAKLYSRQRTVRLKLVQAVQLFGKHERTVIVSAPACHPLSLVDLGTEYARLGTFIREEALRRGE